MVTIPDNFEVTDIISNNFKKGMNVWAATADVPYTPTDACDLQKHLRDDKVIDRLDQYGWPAWGYRVY